MIVVIIAGGSGTRLWPLSTPTYPKHLLKLTNEDSLLQNTLKRARRLASDEEIFIIPEASHSEHVKKQLQDFPHENFLIEPARRGTASCVLFAMQHLKKQGLDPDEAVMILWADHLIRDEQGFTSTFKRAGALAKKYEKSVFIGVEPAYPTTGLGYMEHGPEFDHEPETYELIKFHEKPDRKTAEEYYASGNFFWNTGYMVTTRTTFEEAIKTHSPDYWQSYRVMLEAKDLKKAYLSLESIALDYVFSEKIKGALVIPGNFDWTDIGSFSDLHSISVQDELGNFVGGDRVELEGVTNSYIHNGGGLPVAVIGLDNVVVIHSENGILVTNKNFAQKVGDVSKRIHGK